MSFEEYISTNYENLKRISKGYSNQDDLFHEVLIFLLEKPQKPLDEIPDEQKEFYLRAYFKNFCKKNHSFYKTFVILHVFPILKTDSSFTELDYKREEMDEFIESSRYLKKKLWQFHNLEKLNSRGIAKKVGGSHTTWWNELRKLKEEIKKHFDESHKERS